MSQSMHNPHPPVDTREKRDHADEVTLSSARGKIVPRGKYEKAIVNAIPTTDAAPRHQFGQQLDSFKHCNVMKHKAIFDTSAVDAR